MLTSTHLDTGLLHKSLYRAFKKVMAQLQDQESECAAPRVDLIDHWGRFPKSRLLWSARMKV